MDGGIGSKLWKVPFSGSKPGPSTQHSDGLPLNRLPTIEGTRPLGSQVIRQASSRIWQGFES